jgi:hypothetical protein
VGDVSITVGVPGAPEAVVTLADPAEINISTGVVAGPMGPPGPAGADGAPGPPGPTNAIYTATWTWTTKQTDANTSGQVGINGAPTWAMGTAVNVNEQKADNADVSIYLARIGVGDEIYLQMKTDHTRYGLYLVTGAPTDHGTWWSFPVTFESGSGNLPNGNAPTAFAILSEEAVPLPARATATKTTASLAANASESGTVTITRGYRLYTLQTNRPARLRLYTTTAKRDADAARAIGTDPTGDHGLILEFITTATVLTADLSPMVDGFDGKPTPDGAIPYRITNLDTSTGTVVLTLGYVRTE